MLFRSLENMENVTQLLVVLQGEGDLVSQSEEHLFYLGDGVRDDISTRTEAMQIIGNIEPSPETMLHVNENKSPDDHEAQHLAKVHRLIQERARTETKKRLHTLAESKLSLDKELKLNDSQGPMTFEGDVKEIASLRTLKLKRSWKKLSHKVGKVKNYLIRQGNVIRSDRYTMVQRGALYFVAATSSLLAIQWRKPSPSSLHTDDTEASQRTGICYEEL